MWTLWMVIWGVAWAQEPGLVEDPERLEPGAVVLAAYNGDLGVGVGGVLNLARFNSAYTPYRWRIQLLLALFAKSNGVSPVGTFQNLSLTADLPSSGRSPRWALETYLRHQSNAGWYGLGNGSSFERPWETIDAVSSPEEYALSRQRNDYGRSRVGINASGRMELVGQLDAFARGALTTNRFEIYTGSKLEDDLGGEGGASAQAAVSWAVPHSLSEGAIGLWWDRRDHETSPRSGWLLEGSLRGGLGIGRTGGFWGANLAGRSYLPVTAHTVVATRVLLDTLGGDVPFYELARHGGLVQENAPGGGRSIRGLNLMRLHGRHKVLANVEIRTTLQQFTLANQPSRAGLTFFVDTGRVWAALPADPLLDGDTGFYTSGGAGLFLHWGESFLLRFDVGHSAEGTTGYIDVGHMY